MSKLQQLVDFQQWGVPTSPFRSIQFEDFQKGQWSVQGVPFPVAVRSSFSDEDGQEFSHAGEFRTCLEVSSKDLEEAIHSVFSSYPAPAGTSVIVQQMVAADYSGVLFAFREGIWKMEIGQGPGEAIVGGQFNPDTLLLPKFNRRDLWVSAWYRFWQIPEKYSTIRQALIALSYYAGRLLEKNREALHGLDIEWAVQKGKLFLLQARPITTPAEKEEVLTTANHREILPPRPSTLMTEVISTSGKELFDYYRDLDGSLPKRSFILKAEGMPWINLSALLDIMVSWGLPTGLVIRSIGAEDFYRVGLRPHQAIRKMGVFLKVFSQQLFAQRMVKKWLAGLPGKVSEDQKEREPLWEDQPAEAFLLWFDSFRKLYIELVQHMQLLTGAMSGPLSLLDRLGILPKLAASLKAKSQSTDYYAAFRALSSGGMSRQVFLGQYGHRGFYESDIGQPRFAELTEEEWALLIEKKAPRMEAEPASREGRVRAGLSIWSAVAGALFKAVHLRESVRHELMKQFWVYRKELLAHLPGISPWRYTRSQLHAFLAGELSEEALSALPEVVQSGWDKDTFLWNQNGRRMDLPPLYGGKTREGHPDRGVGIYPGRLKGQVWRVREAGLANLQKPPFETVILVADALDPGWIPYFSQVDGVLAYVGGLLSHASIILRESGVPAITQIPGGLDLQTGDWIEMDGKSGLVSRWTKSD
jgi:phosphohistidine swiveling domain-containing protein